MKEQQIIYKIIDGNSAHRRFDKRSIILGVFAFMFVATLSFLLTANIKKSYAVDFSQFKAGNIISDAVMRNYTSMTESEIQSFLKSKNACNKVATAGWSVNAGTFNGVKYNYRYDYNGTTYLYHVENGRHVCMADESFNGESAAHIIYDLSRKYKINPQVLIVLLEKEQGLVTDMWPNVNYQYRSATGFGCPDTAPCDSEYYGLRNQIESAAWLFDQVLSGGWTNYPLGNNWIRYSPDASCGGSNVYIENRATSALYRYTPYQPNQAAINAYPGGATCGAYGNRNFYAFFTNWFGSTQKVQYTFPQNYYNKNKGTTGLLTGETKCVDKNNAVSTLSNDGDYYCSQDFEKGTLFWTTNIKNGVKTEQDEVFYNKQKAEAYKKLTIDQRKDKIYQEWLKNSDTIGNFTATPVAFDKDANYRVFQAEKGVIFGNDKSGYTIYKQKAFNVYKEYYTSLGAPVRGHENNGAMEWYTFKNGLIVGNDNNGWFLSMGASRTAWANQGFEGGALGYPKSQIITDNTMKAVYQEYAKAVLISTNGGKSFIYMNKNAFNAWRKNSANLGGRIGGYETNGSTGIEWFPFEKGLIVGNDSRGWYESRGKIRDLWASTGFEGGQLGFPAGDIVEKDGVYSQKYTGGVISGNDQQGYKIENNVLSRAYEKHKSLLGNQVKGLEKNTATGMEWYTYERGLLVGNNSKGWHISIGKSREVWARKGFESGPLGYPTSDLEKNTATGIEWQYYEHGAVVGNDRKGWFESRGRIREIWASTGFEGGRYGFPVSDIEGRCQRYERGTICE